ncbi:hypothetical protein [Sphingomonas montanisoli]|uniref:Glycosyltransferase RgtA/B/C/D-like domain-containing protein n=1 Tax=Sphingomonas montanisoli TaxID=2606412 RepID=A0A5D9C426_9SPHN|nr:hypothetical protein [Sphingomonas montanisoli]TZG26429.1 hypothetical protein FYJ91_16000 [Sphingomonas montanisoli]
MRPEKAASFAIPALAAIFAIVQIAIFRWGVVTPDGVLQYGQALTGRYDDWHPPVTAWLWRQLLRVAPGGAGYLIFDAALYWGGLALIADGLRRKAGVAAAVALLMVGLLPISFGQIGALLKDTLLACLLTMAAALLWRGWTAGRLVTVVLIVIAAATRFNALFAAAPLLLLALPTRWTRRPWIILSLLVAALGGLAITSNLINVQALKPHRSQPFLSLVNFDLAGIVAHGGANGYPALSDAEARRYTAHCYDPALYGLKDQVGCAAPEESLASWIERPGESGVGVWVNAVLTSPRAYAAHRIAHLNRNWRVAPPVIPNDAVYVMSAPNDLSLSFTARPAAHAVSDAAWAMARSPLGRPFVWILCAAVLLILSPWLAERRFVAALSASALCYGLGYTVFSVASDLRYHLWTMLAAQIALVLTVATGFRSRTQRD